MHVQSLHVQDFFYLYNEIISLNLTTLTKTYYFFARKTKIHLKMEKKTLKASKKKWYDSKLNEN